MTPAYEEIRPLSCQERGCRVLAYTRLDRPVLVYQHGDNMEAVLEIDRFLRGVVRRETWGAWLERGLPGLVPPAALDDWADRVHAYEDAPPAAQEASDAPGE